MKITPSLLILVSLLFGASTSVYAGGGGGGGQALESTQQQNKSLLKNANTINTTTRENTTGLLTKEKVNDPLANKLRGNTVKQIADDVDKWVKGNYTGTPLIVANPEKYIGNAGTVAVKDSLSAIPETSTYGDTFFKTVQEQYKETSLEDKVSSLSQSRVPSIIQNNMCDDTKLTELAKNRAYAQSSSYTEADVQKERQTLYSYACQGDPSTDQDLATKLMDLYKQDSSLGGMNALYAITVLGENEYNKTTQFQNLVAENVGTKKDLATRELFGGDNPIAEKECVTWATDPGGTRYCSQSKVTTPAESISEIFTNVGQQGIFNFLTGAQGDEYDDQWLEKTSEEDLGDGYDDEEGNDWGDTDIYNESTTTTSSPTYQDDLKEDEVYRQRLISSIKKEIGSYIDSLNDLETLDHDYMAVLQPYNTKISSIKTCYDSIVARGIVPPTDTRVVQAMNFYTERNGRITTKTTAISNELLTIPQAMDIANTTQEKILASYSSEEISDLYNDYKTKLDLEGYPTSATESERRAELDQDREDIEADKQPDSYLSTCNQIEQSYTSSQYSSF